MKKRIVVIIFIITLVLVLLFGANTLYDFWSNRTIKTEIYENDKSILTIDYHPNDSLSFSIKSKYNSGYLGCGADFISDNVAVFDGKNAFPEMKNTYLKFVFFDDYVEFYNNDDKTLFYKIE